MLPKFCSRWFQVHETVDRMERGELNNDSRVPDSGSEKQENKHMLQSPTTGSLTLLNTEKIGPESPKASWSKGLTKVLPSLRSTESLDPLLVIRKLKDPPRGYPNLACFLDSDEDFMIYRRFGFLQQRILLHKQDELRALEEDLDEMDEDDALLGEEGEKLLTCRETDDRSSGQRKELIKKIQVTFKEYSELMNAARDMMAFGRPTNRDYTSVRNYFKNEAPLVENERYIYRKEDVITLKPGRENAWLDGMIEKGLKRFSCGLLHWLFCSPETREKAKGDELTVLYAKERVGYLVTLIITTMILMLLIIPIYLLWHLSSQVQTGYNTAVTVGVLLVFTLIFSGVLSFFTRARRHEILASAAAYCAVLVVFLSNVGANNGISVHP